MIHIKKIILMLFCLIIPSISYGETQTEIVDKIQNKYKSINDFYATFRQDQTIKALDKVQTANGEIWYKKDSKMRWNYYTPNKNQIVSDGNILWYYDNENNYVSQSDLKDISSNPNLLSILSDLDNLNKFFNMKVTTIKEDDIPYYLIDLIPLDSEDESTNKIRIAIEQNNMIIKKLFFYDPYNNLTVVKLNNIEINKGIKDKVFEFKIPKGVEIVTPPQVVPN